MICFWYLLQIANIHIIFYFFSNCNSPTEILLIKVKTGCYVSHLFLLKTNRRNDLIQIQFAEALCSGMLIG